MLYYPLGLVLLLVLSLKHTFLSAFELDESPDSEDGSNSVFSGCGKSSFTKGLTSRILGGENATQRDWPWHVQLESVLKMPMSKNSSEVHYAMKIPVCGASLISKDWVLTAAHCVYRFGKNVKNLFKLQIVLGDGDNPNATVVRSAKSIFVYPFYEYVISQMKSDLALILLDKSVRFTHDISPICLIDTDLDLTGHTAYLTGRGLTNKREGRHMFLGGDKPRPLQSAEMEILHNSECLEMLSNDEGCPHCKRILKTSDSVICAGLPDSSVSAAKGDSGGPLVVQRFDGTWNQVGVVSSGHPEYRFGIFTKVAKHLKWIDEVLQIHTPREEPEEVEQMEDNEVL